MTQPISEDLNRNLAHFHDCMELAGYFVLPSVISLGVLEVLREEIERVYDIERPIQIHNGLGEATIGTVHHLPAVSQIFLSYLESTPARPYIDRFFGGNPYVLNSMGGNLNLPGQPHYASNIHRDQRSYSNRLRTMLNTFVALDDTTKDNGATWLMWGSHRREEKPTEEQFYRSAAQIEVPAGSIILWHSDLWHCAGRNTTDRPRRIITPIYSRPFYKPGFAYDKALAGAALTDYQKQVLGFNARIPETLDEWYATPEKRMYLPGQG